MGTPHGAGAMISGPSTHSASVSTHLSGWFPLLEKLERPLKSWARGFTGTTAVSFNGLAATFHVVSQTYLTATVPTGATNGYVTVTTPSGVLKSNQVFRIH
jgi:hypothetical protein